jgi:hypothetical protein
MQYCISFLRETSITDLSAEQLADRDTSGACTHAFFSDTLRRCTEGTMECIAYKKGYKYQLREAYSTNIGIKPNQDIATDYIALTSEGTITVKDGYAWDGPSGLTIDTLNFMRGSLVHDALYQLMREGHLDKGEYREQADRLLREMCKEDGMNRLRASLVYRGVRIGGDPSADPAHKKPIIKAPKSCQ